MPGGSSGTSYASQQPLADAPEAAQAPKRAGVGGKDSMPIYIDPLHTWNNALLAYLQHKLAHYSCPLLNSAPLCTVCQQHHRQLREGLLGAKWA